MLAAGVYDERNILTKGQGSWHASHYAKQFEQVCFTVASHIPEAPLLHFYSVLYLSGTI